MIFAASAGRYTSRRVGNGAEPEDSTSQWPSRPHALPGTWRYVVAVPVRKNSSAT